MLHNIDLNIVKNSTGTIEDLSNYLKDKQVTKNSKFGDEIWEFETKPNTNRVNFSKHEKKLDNKHLVVFWKLLTYLVILIKGKKNKSKSVFVSTSSSLISYLNSIGFPSYTIGKSIFTSQNTLEYIDILQATEHTSLYKSHQLDVIKNWLYVNKYLPSFFQLSSSSLLGIETHGIFDEKEKDEDWSPLTISDAMFLTREAIIWVEQYANDILNVYSVWKDYAGKYPKYNTFEAFGDHHIDRNGVGPAKNKKLAEIVYNNFPKEPDGKHPLYNIWFLGNEFSSNRLSGKKLKSSIKQKDIMLYLRGLYGACITLIFMSTGMRRSELMLLQRGCIDNSTNTDIPLIETEVTKTDTGITKLPISRIGVKAVQVIERLGKIITGEDNGPLVIPIERNKKDTNLNKVANYASHAETMLNKFCKIINYGRAPNPHSFRHTLAACIWERTDQAPILLKMLYNHSSLSMTLYYLRSNPLIKQAQKELFTKKYLPLVREVIHGAKNDELAGKASPKVHSLIQYVQNDLQFKGKTEEELGTAMEELFMTLIEQDQIHLFLTPFCVCMRTNTSTTKSPCMHVEDHGDSLYSKLPRTDRCVGANCHDSLFTSSHQESIHKCMTFYNESLEYVPDDLKSNIYFAKIVENESTKYQKINRQLSKKRRSNA